MAYYASLMKWPIRLRWHLLKLEEMHDIAVDELTEVREEGDFTFSFAPLNREEDFEETFSSFSQSIFHIVAYLLTPPRTGMSFLLRGQKSLIQVGNFWTGRPHIYLIRFDKQAELSSENETLYKNEFGYIIAKHWSESSSLGVQYLPPDSRVFDDYNSYITSTATLWAWSGKGLKNRRETANINHADLIYEPQATMEILEYAYMLHRSLFERALGHGRLQDVLSARRDLVILKHHMSEVGHFLEIRDLLQNGWESMGIEGLQQRISESLAIRESETASDEARTTERMGRVLAILFGLVAVPPIAEDVIKPIWDYFELWHPGNPLLNKIFLILIAFVLIAGLTLGLLSFVKKRRSSS